MLTKEFSSDAHAKHLSKMTTRQRSMVERFDAAFLDGGVRWVAPGTLTRAGGALVTKAAPRSAPPPAKPSAEALRADREARAAKAIAMCAKLGDPSDDDDAIGAVLALAAKGGAR